MKHLSLTILAFLIATAAFAQSPCNPQFEYSGSVGGNALLNVFFYNATSTSNDSDYITYYIDYGDGSGGTFFTQGTHNYSAPGTYTVTLTMTAYDATDSNILCTGSNSQNVTVAYPSACASTITYLIDSSSSTQLTETFTAATPGGATGMTYSWNFNDGSAMATGTTVSHTFTTGGYHTVGLTATSSQGCTYYNSADVFADIFNCDAMSADFSDNISSSTVSFSDNSTFISYIIGTQTAVWDFGDGSSATTSFLDGTTHTYTATGTYNVTLTTTWNDSGSNMTCSHSAMQTVTIDSLTPPPSIISGYVYSGSDTILNSNGIITVWLIKYDSATTSLSVADSDFIYSFNSATGSYYEFDNVPAGQYRVKAAISYNSLALDGYVPTYDSSSLYWSDAMVISYNAGTTSANNNIFLQYGPVTSGPGFIGGNVTQGANKGTSADPVTGLGIFLRDANNMVKSYTVTDANGSYSFSNIANGTYSIYPEALNYATTPSGTVTVGNGNETAGNMNFQQHTVSKTITPITTAVAGINKEQNISIYPNPAKDIVTIQWQNNLTNARLTISNAVGQKVYSADLNANAKSQSVNLSNLKDGIYFINIAADKYSHVQKLAIQH